MENIEGVCIRGIRFPLKAAGVMHTVALRTEATITTSGEMPPNLGQAFKVRCT